MEAVEAGKSKKKPPRSDEMSESGLENNHLGDNGSRGSGPELQRKKYWLLASIDLCFNDHLSEYWYALP